MPKPKRQPKKFAVRNRFSCKAVILAALLSLLLVFLMPLMLLLSGGLGKQDVQAPSSALFPFARPQAEEEPPQEETPALSGPPPAGTLDSAATVTVLLNGAPQTMTMGEYLWGVVAAEAPASFEPEALRAQAVAARTYTLYCMGHPNEHHPNAHICGDPGCCQAWISYPERMADWGADAKIYEAKVSEAIRSTDGMALYYHSEPIFSAFHAASAGSTKSALEVWGEDYPYLQEVASPETEEGVPNYYSTVTVSAQKFAKKVKKIWPAADLTAEDCSAWFGEVENDPAGLPVAIQVGGVKADTVKLRELFELRSPSFTVEGKEGKVTFYVTGYGHGVGMSQYGANALAKEGKTAEEILAWYYPGSELVAAS